MRKLALTLAAFGLAAGAASAQPAPQHNSCFFVNQFQSWKAPDAKTIYLRINSSRYYRLDLASECSRLQSPGARLIMNVRGPDTICSAIDWDLQVNDGLGGNIATPCIVKTMTELSPEQAAAIPKKYKP